VTVQQRDEAWLLTATAEQVHNAHQAGELNQLMGKPLSLDDAPAAAGEAPVQRDQGWIDQASPRQLAAAYDRGELRGYIAG
jgi:hypothetical protein